MKSLSLPINNGKIVPETAALGNGTPSKFTLSLLHVKQTPLHYAVENNFRDKVVSFGMLKGSTQVHQTSSGGARKKCSRLVATVVLELHMETCPT